MMYRFKFKSRLDQMSDRYEVKVRDALSLPIQNPHAGKLKLMKVKALQEQIDELKLAYIN